MDKLFRLINIEQKSLFILTQRDNQLFKRKGEIGKSLQIEKEVYSDQSTLEFAVSSYLEELEQLNYEEIVEDNHAVQVIVKLKRKEQSEDDFWDLLLERDELEDEIDKEIIKLSMGEYVGSSGNEFVYDLWKIEDNVQRGISIIKRVLKSFDLEQSTILVDGKEIDNNYLNKFRS